MTDEEPKEIPTQLSMRLPDDMEVGVFADFVNVWHTPNTFVLDFLSVKQPPIPVTDEQTGNVQSAVLETSVGARVRIPSEQIFPLIKALETQGQQWLTETGRSEPPTDWLPNPPSD